jgi:hypothetical protein
VGAQVGPLAELVFVGTCSGASPVWEFACVPSVNLPNSGGKSHWGEGITAEDMKKFKWVKPRVVVEVAFVEWDREWTAPASDVCRHSGRRAADGRATRAVARHESLGLGGLCESGLSAGVLSSWPMRPSHSARCGPVSARLP